MLLVNSLLSDGDPGDPPGPGPPRSICADPGIGIFSKVPDRDPSSRVEDDFCCGDQDEGSKDFGE